MMNRKNIFLSLFFLICFFLLFIMSTSVEAEREDTAHLHFEKSATQGKNNGTYTVKKGEWLANIIRKEIGVESYAEIKQVIEEIKILNPNIKNLNIIHPGQVLRMPFSSNGGSQVGEASYTEKPNKQTEQKSSAQTDVFVPDAQSMAVLEHIIRNIKGTLITQGLYHIPLPQNGQITIDCKKIPIIEFNDGNTVLIDFSSGMPDMLRKLIQTSWKHYHIANYSKQDSIVSILQKIIAYSKSYEMIKMSKLFKIADHPQVQLYSDWVISQKTEHGRQKYIQTLTFLSNDSQLLPRPIVEFAEKQGVIMTEIVDHRGVMRSELSYESMLNMTNLNASTNKDLIAALLTTLECQIHKDADVRVYNEIKGGGGFNLTIKVDYYIEKAGRNFIINSNQMSHQLLDILKEEGAEIIFYHNNEPRDELIDRILKTMNFNYSFDSFSFALPETGPTKASICIPAFRVVTDIEPPVYLINFEMDYDLYRIIQTLWRLKIAKY
ncbi:MAG: LysM peptidoglycan-binding domain-containing protein [Deltaproteobacteria bacterium]|nr:LysM peptidoglycan-binding domain-containing protein [Deltaproteobacteria bacterium]